MAEATSVKDTKNEGFNGVNDSLLGKYYCRLLIGKFSRPSPFKSALFETPTMIHLPLPDILQDNTSVNYSGVQLESVGDFVNGDIAGGSIGAVSRGVGNILSGAVSNFSGSAANALTQAFGGNKELGDRIGGMVNGSVRETFPPDLVQSAFEQAMGTAPNPNPSVAFQGPNLREFGLSWTFFPVSKTESDKIHNVIKILKRASLSSSASSSGAAILNYPDMVQLNFFPWDGGEAETGPTNPWYWSKDSIIRIKKCVMNSVSVDYNPSNSPAFFADEKPVAVRLSIGFSEIEYMLSNDWGETRETSTYVQIIERANALAIDRFGGITGQAAIFGALSGVAAVQ
jgi:hypothetical protein